MKEIQSPQLSVTVANAQDLRWEQREILVTLGQQTRQLSKDEDPLRFDFTNPLDVLEVVLKDTRDPTSFGICVLPVDRFKRNVVNDFVASLIRYNLIEGNVQSSCMLKLHLKVTITGLELAKFINVGCDSLRESPQAEIQCETIKDVHIRLWRHSTSLPLEYETFEVNEDDFSEWPVHAYMKSVNNHERSSCSETSSDILQSASPKAAGEGEEVWFAFFL